ncbi:MAG TPA: hypothetical protein PLK61_04075 [Nitrosomonas sp.]|nr:hypothetical protein [Nitrosomonas sp.]
MDFLPINWALFTNPVNWVIVTLMVLIAGVLLRLLIPVPSVSE